MSAQVAEGLVMAFGVYAAIGVAFAVAFASFGVGVVEPKSHGAGWGFRALIVPGSAALWPWLAVRWARASSSAKERL